MWYMVHLLPPTHLKPNHRWTELFSPSRVTLLTHEQPKGVLTSMSNLTGNDNIMERFDIILAWCLIFREIVSTYGKKANHVWTFVLHMWKCTFLKWQPFSFVKCMKMCSLHVTHAHPAPQVLFEDLHILIHKLRKLVSNTTICNFSRWTQCLCHFKTHKNVLNPWSSSVAAASSKLRYWRAY